MPNVCNKGSSSYSVRNDDKPCSRDVLEHSGQISLRQTVIDIKPLGRTAAGTLNVTALHLRSRRVESFRIKGRCVCEDMLSRTPLGSAVVRGYSVVVMDVTGIVDTSGPELGQSPDPKLRFK